MGNTSNLPQISTVEVQSKLNNSEILFVDVRGASELSAGKLDAKNFLNIPHTGLLFYKKYALSFSRNFKRIQSTR